MKVSVQTDNIRLLREAVKSQCSGIRFGPEFCEHLLPSLPALERAYELACEAGKEFTYVTPRLTNAGVEKLRAQLPFLNERDGVHVVANDFGALNMLPDYANVRPQLGRNLFLVPGRSAWAEGHIQSEEPTPDNWIGGWVRELYSTTSLNYPSTIALYRSYSCERADIDGVPHILPALRELAGEGFRLSILVYLIPVTFTRKCHMARFLGMESPETCTMPCLTRAFILRNEALNEYEREFGVALFLSGNTVFRVVEPSPQDIADWEAAGVAEVVLPMGPVTRIDTSEQIDDFILSQCTPIPAL